MSWTEIFPVMDDDMVERYQQEASTQDKEAMSGHRAIKLGTPLHPVVILFKGTSGNFPVLLDSLIE